MIKVEVGNQKNVESYCRSVVSLVSDQGQASRRSPAQLIIGPTWHLMQQQQHAWYFFAMHWICSLWQSPDWLTDRLTHSFDSLVTGTMALAGTERGISKSCKINLSVVEHNDAEALGTTIAEEGRQVVVQEDDQSLLSQVRQQRDSLLQLVCCWLLISKPSQARLRWCFFLLSVVSLPNKSLLIFTCHFWCYCLCHRRII